MTTTIERKTRAVPPTRPTATDSGRRMTRVVAMGLLALLIGFGAGWLAFGNTGTTPTAVEDVVIANRDAWVANDGEAAVATMAPTARFYSSFVPRGVTGDLLVNHINNSPTAFIGDLEITEVVGDGPYVVILTNTQTDNGDYSVSYVEEIGGEFKITGHIWFD